MRTYPERPIVGVGAVVFDGGRVLLVKRANPPLQHQWNLPGGAVELGEPLRAAVGREVLEETGLQVAVGPVVDVVDRVHHDDDGAVRYHYVIVDYLCSVVGGRLACATDAADVCWADLAALGEHGVSAPAAAVIHKALALYRQGGDPYATPGRPASQNCKDSV